MGPVLVSLPNCLFQPTHSMRWPLQRDRLRTFCVFLLRYRHSLVLKLMSRCEPAIWRRWRMMLLPSQKYTGSSWFYSFTFRKKKNSTTYIKSCLQINCESLYVIECGNTECLLGFSHQWGPGRACGLCCHLFFPTRSDFVDLACSSRSCVENTQPN